MSFTKTRAWVAGTVVLCLLLTVAAWFLLISPKRAEAQDLREQAVAAAEANDRTRVQIAELKKEFANLQVRQAELSSLEAALPPGDELAAFTREVDQTAKNSGVSLDSIAPGAPIAVIPEPAAAPASAPAEGSEAQSSGAAAAPAAPPASGLVEIPVTITVTGGYQQNLKFLQGLQTSIKRNYLVIGLNVSSPPNMVDTSGKTPEEARAQGWASMTITGKVFALPEDAAATSGGAAPAGQPATTSQAS